MDLKEQTSHRYVPNYDLDIMTFIMEMDNNLLVDEFLVTPRLRIHVFLPVYQYQI